MKRILLCADDYSLSPAISEGILKLVKAGRLSAVSCLASSPTWAEDARALAACAGNFQAGLHFNLTLPLGIRERRVSLLLAAALAGRIDRRSVAAAFDRQWSAFVREFGRPPDFVDGHQHVHVFPGIREVIVERIVRSESPCWVRTLRPPAGLRGGPFKQRLLERLSEPLSRALMERGIPTNPAFAGFRPYRRPRGFAADFARWLAHSDDGTLIMCHPGLASEDRTDPIRHCRVGEFEFLGSDSLLEALELSGKVAS